MIGGGNDQRNIYVIIYGQNISSPILRVDGSELEELGKVVEC